MAMTAEVKSNCAGALVFFQLASKLQAGPAQPSWPPSRLIRLGSARFGDAWLALAKKEYSRRPLVLASGPVAIILTLRALGKRTGLTRSFETGKSDQLSPALAYVHVLLRCMH